MAEQIRWEVCGPCKAGRHADCWHWWEGYVDGQVRRAGTRCNCSHDDQTVSFTAPAIPPEKEWPYTESPERVLDLDTWEKSDE